MIKAEDIYKVTNNGLDIILHYYPQARDCVGTNHRQARTLIRKLDRDELLQVLLRSYLSQ